jgi:hypothetical protein
MSDPSIQQFKGFASQLEWAAKQHREKYLMQLLTNGLTIGGQGMGKTVSIDGIPVTPVNRATAMLYSYTPHIHGNLVLWRIWQRWFSITYPDGTLVRAVPSGKVYLIRYGEKRAYESEAVAASRMDLAKAVTAADNDLQAYPDGPTIRFAPYSLLRNPAGQIFLLTTDAKRHIADMTAFRKFGFNIEEVADATDEDLAAYPDGPMITADTEFPQGVLMKTATAPGVWYVEDNQRHALVDSVFIKLYFRGRRVQTVTQKTLDAITIADPYKLHDGELVKSDSAPAVYVVENGLLRPIPSGDVFEAVGWDWKNVVTVKDAVIALHGMGEPFVPQHASTQTAQTL